MGGNMSYKKTTMLFLLIFILMNTIPLFAQPREPDPNTGNRFWDKSGVMDGNLARTIFYNHGEIAHYNTPYSGEWPKGSGHLYVDGVAAFVQVECIDEDTNIIHPMSINYREDIDFDENGYARGWWPLPGYCAYYQDSPAMSDDPNSWPVNWPDKPADWAGYWNGYFGKGVKNADLETYYVMDDDYDTEWNFYPDSTDTTRRGIGLEVAVRGFQWSHVLAEDCIFWHFAITNEGTYDFEKVLFGFYVDWGIGQSMPSPGGSDDCGSYDTDIDLAYAWAVNNASQWGGKAGVAGFAYLESPGNPWDDLDNDNDGIVDESRVSGPGVWEYSSCGYYKEDGSLDEDARESGIPFVRWHWSGDEDGDWTPFTDRNDNGIHDPDEPLNDDLGADGIGPIDEGYIGPDEGEGDGIPTQGEPDFDQTDKDESDQIGLTGFRIFNVHEYPMSNEEMVWPIVSELRPPTEEQLLGVNLAMYFASGLFPLHPGETQRFSMALLFGEEIDDLRRNKKTVQAIYNANYNFSRPPDKPRITAIPGDGKVILSWDKTAEDSYDRYLQEYDFEGYRIYRSTEPSFLEARLITDAYGNPTFRKPIAQYDLANGINGPHLIDVYGVKFNLGDDTGLRHTFVDSNVNNGQTYYYAVVSYDRGFIARDSLGNILFDEDENPIGISPTECTSTLFIDETGAVVTDVNTAVVVPNAPAAGYSPPKVESGIKREGPGTGDIEVVFINPEAVKDSSLYRIIISDTSLLHLDKAPTYTLIRDTLPDDPFSLPETLATGINLVGPEDETAVFGGLVVHFRNDTGANVIDSLSDWIVNENKCKLEVGFNPTFTNEFNPIFNLNRHYPADLKLAFYDTIVDRSKALLGMYQRIWTNFTIWNLTGDSLNQPFLFDNKDKDPEKRFSIRYIATYYAGDSIDVDTTSDEIITLVPDSRSAVDYWTSWQFKLRGSPFSLNSDYMNADTVSVDTTIVYTEPGDIYSLVTTHPFRGEWMDLEGDTLGGDEFEFVVRKGYLDIGMAKDSLKNIAVVPNPYVVAASWEPPNPYAFGRGKRKIDFIHLPQKCTIRIYTLRGNLVKTIEHNTQIRDGAESWDLVTKDGMDVSYGIYIYHVEAPGIGEHVGKFAVIK
jgi:hypothetical protein